MPQIGGLLIGYNFGSWQFWNISASGREPIHLDFSSLYSPDALPVIGFCFQEPENDPRNFVYIWALRGENDLDSEEEKEALSNTASIMLHSLAFQNRDENDSGVLYSGFISCQPKFTHQLDTAIPGRDSQERPITFSVKIQYFHFEPDLLNNLKKSTLAHSKQTLKTNRKCIQVTFRI